MSKADVSGKSVLITGCGPVGLFAVAVARALGATTIYATDMSDYRLNLAKKAGANVVFKPNETDVAQAIREATPHGVDVVLEMSGNARALQSGFDALASGGTVALLGIPPSAVTLDLTNAIIFKEATVIGIHGREIFQTWFLMLDLLTSGQLNIADIITHRFPLTDFQSALDLMESGQCGKIVLSPA